MNLSKTIICVLAALTMASCGQSSSTRAAAPNGTSGDGGSDGPNNTQPVETYKELTEDQIQRECSTSDVAAIKVYEQLIKSSNEAVDNTKGKKDDQVIKDGIKAILVCDQMINRLDPSRSGACRMTIPGTIVDPTKVIINFYDQFRVDQKCQKTDSYLTKYNSRPSKMTSVDPTELPITGDTPPPNIMPVAPGGPLKQCSKDEFARLNEMVSLLKPAIKRIEKLGSWKYDTDTISDVAQASKSCEALIKYHDQQPCERTIDQIVKQYTGVTLRQRCEKARSYFYDFVQNTKTLVFPNADLFLNVSHFENKFFELDSTGDAEGCRIRNISQQAIDYSGRSWVLVKDTRFDKEMMTLTTVEGLELQCIGLNIQETFSKNEVVRVLQEEQTHLPMVYRLK